MARIPEHRGKALLREAGIAVPAGMVVTAADQVGAALEQSGLPAVVKAQANTTGRAGMGAIAFAESADRVRAETDRMLGMTIGGFPVSEVLIEEKLDIDREFYAGIIVDDAGRSPAVIVSSVGGTGIEQIATAHPDKVASHTVDIRWGLREFEARELVRRTGITGKLQMQLARAITRLYAAARRCEARSAEINPFVQLKDGTLAAADCRMTIDDYAVFRHRDLGIEIARELAHPPTELDRIAYAMEKDDYRGTFYFIQTEGGFGKGEGFVGFHGAGGGGSMMSMDSLTRQGYKIANFCDTSGNPPASKVYRAAKIILSQPNIDGYFGSGSGVASQEQFHSARGLVKAFREDRPEIPIVIRLGGNQEDRAVQILVEYTKDLPCPVEGYKKDDPPDYCAERIDKFIQTADKSARTFQPFTKPVAKEPYAFATVTGLVTLDHAACRHCESKVCVETCVPQILELKDGIPVLNISTEDAKKGKCTECLACEVECQAHGAGGGYVDLPIAGLEAYRAGVRRP